MVASMEKSGIKVWGVYPGGQSGNPGSPYYNNLLSHWEKGEYYQFHFSNSDSSMKASALKTLTIKPTAQ